MVRRLECPSLLFRIALVALIGGLFLATTSYAGVQTSGHNTILPSDSTLVISESITLDVQITNSSSNTEPPNTDDVPAVLTGVMRVQLACTTSSCATPLPGVLSFDSCDNLAAGVASCALDAGDVTGNTVAITMAGGGVAIGAASTVTLARLHVTASAPVGSPASGDFNVKAQTGDNNLEACQDPPDSIDPVAPCTTGGTDGSATLFFPPGPATTSLPTSTSITSTSTTSTTATSTSTTSTTLVTPTGCGASPMVSCLQASDATVVIKETVSGRERLKVVLKQVVPAVTQAEFGDPVSGATRYDVCLYGDALQLVANLTVDRAAQVCGSPPKVCWQPVSSIGYRYKDRAAAADGVQRLLLKGGPAGAGKVTLKAGNNAGKGQTSLPAGLTTALQGSTQLTVQVLSSDAACVGHVLTDVVRADLGTFVAH